MRLSDKPSAFRYAMARKELGSRLTQYLEHRISLGYRQTSLSWVDGTKTPQSGSKSRFGTIFR
jgi:hypothetical protein